MTYVKLKNFIPKGGGQADYKGLDLSLIIPGSQFYDEAENAYYFVYESESGVTTHQDIVIIDESTYNQAKNSLSSEYSDPIAELQAQQDALTLEILQLKGLV